MHTCKTRYITLLRTTERGPTSLRGLTTYRWRMKLWDEADNGN